MCRRTRSTGRKSLTMRSTANGLASRAHPTGRTQALDKPDNFKTNTARDLSSPQNGRHIPSASSSPKPSQAISSQACVEPRP
jgi:hypothetical protein